MEAEAKLGLFLAGDTGLSLERRDLQSAVLFFAAAAQRGYPDWQHMLAPVDLGGELKMSFKLAEVVGRLTDPATSADGAHQFLLAELYFHGSSDVPRDPAEAAHWAEAAA